MSSRRPRPHEEYDNPSKPAEEQPASTFLDRPWWRWIAVGVAALVVGSFAIPVLSPFFDRGGVPPDPPPGSASAARAPDFLLPAAYGGTVRLFDEVRRNDAVVIVFYRGYF